VWRRVWLCPGLSGLGKERPSMYKKGFRVGLFVHSCRIRCSRCNSQQDTDVVQDRSSKCQFHSGEYIVSFCVKINADKLVCC